MPSEPPDRWLAFDAPPPAPASDADAAPAAAVEEPAAEEPVAEFRSSLVLIPLTSDGEVWTGAWGGVQWIYAFSGKPELSEFLRARGESQDIAYASVRGWRLLDIAVPAIGRPAGVALDVGSDRPVFFPPLAGIVPDAAALDVQGGD